MNAKASKIMTFGPCWWIMLKGRDASTESLFHFKWETINFVIKILFLESNKVQTVMLFKILNDVSLYTFNFIIEKITCSNLT